MPFFQAPPAAASGGVLRHKHRMAAKWGLFTVIARLCSSQAFFNKVSGMVQYRFQALVAQIIPVFGIQAKLAAEPGFSQAGE